MKFVVSSVLWLCVAATTFGKAAFFPFPEMIHFSEIIAVVHVTKLAEGEFKGPQMTYRQKATISVSEVLKGQLPPGTPLYGMEDFICAQCRFPLGQQLVFLRAEGSFLTGSNWHLSIRPITRQGIEWFKNRKTLELETIPAARVLDEVKKEIAAQARKTTSAKDAEDANNGSP